MPVDLTKYLTRITDVEERKLLNEAVICGTNNALRACFLMLWITLVESLKRRFIVIGQSDSEIHKVVVQFRKLESEEKAVDKYLLDQGKKYDFYDAKVYNDLVYFYSLRSIIIHPYTTQVTVEQIENSASIIVNQVLVTPLKLRYSYGEQLISNLLEHHYIDHTQESVKKFTKSVLARMDKVVYPWFIKRYLSELEKINMNRTNINRDHLLYRGIWFIRTTLEKNARIFSASEYHDLFIKYPYIMSHILRKAVLYGKMGLSVKNSMVQYILDSHLGFPNLLVILEELQTHSLLHDKQTQKFQRLVLEADIDSLLDANLSFKTLSPRVLAMLEDYSFEINKKAIELLQCESESLSSLENEIAYQIGFRLIVLYHKNCFKAQEYIQKYAYTDLPFDMLRGMLHSCFIHPTGALRSTYNGVNYVASTINAHTSKNEFLEDLTMHLESIDSSFSSFTSSRLESLKEECPDIEFIDQLIKNIVKKQEAIASEGKSDE